MDTETSIITEFNFVPSQDTILYVIKSSISKYL